MLKERKRNKTRDHNGLINEMFRTEVMGHDMKMALLDILNLIKKCQIVPEILQYANISTICKKKGSRQQLDND